eukprot:CAMPEP_0170622284 /NCGR_PEP_ID=MMETSP0224-20130122/29046_1 /TAXON_ID=285029 /ORGANISM="Togula jolla, Strain CCCM 725" /LENGTH=194 /DNA_ID=CAMNT_0010948587 /DNA_START=66 /DNA_END=647 /DNA_ORIENTATION=-
MISVIPFVALVTCGALPLASASLEFSDSSLVLLQTAATAKQPLPSDTFQWVSQPQHALANTLTENTEALSSQAHDWRAMDGLTVYVMFDKSGSSTARQALVTRSSSFGWKTGTAPDGDSLGCPQARQREGYVGCDYEPCHALAGPPRCNYQPAGGVIQSRDYGYCEEMHKTAEDARSQRPCRYFTIMREPISRL